MSKASDPSQYDGAPLPQRKANPGPKVLKEVRQHRSFPALRAIGALILREVQTSHARTSGGYLWAIAEPVGGILMLTLIFQAFLKAPPIGIDFSLFYATGVIPFMGYMDISGKVASSITYSKGLLQYPAVTFADAIIARIIFGAITQVMVAIFVFTGILILFDTRADPQMDLIAISLLMSISLASAIGSLNCFMNAAFGWWHSIWSILMKPMFLLSGIFFIYDDIPQPFRDYLWWNPLIHVVGQMRRAFYPSYVGDYVSVSYVLGLSLLLFAIGFALLVRFHRDLQYS